jgi:hypothetical protein
MMLNVEAVDLGARGVRFPADQIGVVMAQPHVPIESLTNVEPFKFTNAAAGQQLALLQRTLAVARNANHGLARTHFTLFPEYSIPGLQGVQQINQVLNEAGWPTGSIVLGGCDALTQAEYAQLLAMPGTHVAADNAAERVQAGSWVNCAVIWVKGADGAVERWVQPKIHPAWEELDTVHQQMFAGRSIFLFQGLLENGVPFRFAVLVCFDWIAQVAQRRPSQWLLQALHEQANGNQLPLSWMFVVQRNPKPSHDTFLNAVQGFFDQTQFPNALRANTCLLFANTAGAAKPARAKRFGGASVVLSPQTLFSKPKCALTYANGGPNFRDGSTLLRDYLDVYFRERGACIHSFRLVNPSSIVAGAAGRTAPVENADVFPVGDDPEPRAPGGAVSAATKWFNDELDVVDNLGALYPAAPLALAVTGAQNSLVADLRTLNSQTVTNAVCMSADDSNGVNGDDWLGSESQALEHLVHSLSILSMPFPGMTVDVAPAHATIMIGAQPIDVLTIRGTTHEGCIRHSQKHVPNPRRHVLLISRDRDNTHWIKRFGNFLQPDTPGPEQERKITDPSPATLHLGYQNLLALYRDANTAIEIHAGINAELAA